MIGVHSNANDDAMRGVLWEAMMQQFQRDAMVTISFAKRYMPSTAQCTTELVLVLVYSTRISVNQSPYSVGKSLISDH